MLDTDTKRRIDTARDILVGKIPDPKSQVEQITIALIYKFMDDLDAEAEEMGGKRKFFAGDFGRYGWAKLMRAGLGGHETLNLYAEAIAKMPENPGIPPLFRDIFKNAYLPYRDPETLRAFLKVIDEFSYDHSERLGDAFEYLLSVLGSQGDAGQFRTPRHIIDFMVAIVDPKKTETVLDPACGTAGFLISSYKHILRANTDANGDSTLTPDDKGRLAQNFKGYDISPDMVRLSLVNLYLHGFTDPHIVEYDTLTSQDRWNEHADVILANPPFMSPKGGIRPHNRFSVQSKRSEVLFVDYMAEHLTPNGRAAIIVPEGVIFQSQTAYIQLRKMLVDNYLVAVVSLPAGVFNPYSGVKTSILILDKPLARRARTVAFLRIENDGFGLGAQRRPIDRNDLPQAQAEIAEYLRRLQAGDPVMEFLPTTSQIVSKAKIAESGDYNLSAERYGEQTHSLQTKWPPVSLGEICTFTTGGTPASTVAEYYENGTVPWLVSGDIHGFEIWDCARRITPLAVEKSNARVLPKDSVLIALNGQGKTRGTVALLRMDNATCNQSLVAITPAKPPRVMSEYVFWTLRSMYSEIRALTGDTERSGLNIPILKRIEIPLPPIDVQREIVADIAGYQKVIDGARAVLDNYRPHIPIAPEWPKVELGEICEAILTGPFGTSLHQSDYVPNGIPVINPQNIVAGAIVKDDAKSVSLETRERLKEFTVRENDIVIARRGEMGRCAVVLPGMNGWIFGTGCFVIRLKAEYDVRFVFYQIASPQTKAYLEDQAVGVTMLNLNQQILSALRLPIPPLATQRRIVGEIGVEQDLVASNRELITRFERKIQATLSRIWGEDKLVSAEA